MNTSILLIWFLVIVSLVMIRLMKKGILKKWPKIPVVSLFSNLSIIFIYYSPLYGDLYYLANLVKIIPLIMLLVYFSSIDPEPSWGYRAMCWVFIMQIAIYAIHIMTGLNFLYYSQSFLASVLLEFVVIISGGLNVRPYFVNKNNNDNSGFKICHSWTKQNQKSRG